jgi:transcriptional regulator with XRE-family HTH domain
MRNVNNDIIEEGVMMMSLGLRLKEARQKKKLSQREVAKKIGVSISTLSGYEIEYRDPSTETLTEMAKLYEVSVEWLLTGKVDNLDEYSTRILNELKNIDDDVKKEILQFIRFRKSH